MDRAVWYAHRAKRREREQTSWRVASNAAGIMVHLRSSLCVCWCAERRTSGCGGFGFWTCSGLAATGGAGIVRGTRETDKKNMRRRQSMKVGKQKNGLRCFLGMAAAGTRRMGSAFRCRVDVSVHREGKAGGGSVLSAAFYLRCIAAWYGGRAASTLDAA